MDPFVIHAWCMATAWLLLVPIGILAARFLKVLPGQDWPQETDNQLWWWTHRICQYGGVALATIGAFVVWQAAGEPALRSAHAQIGLFVLVLVWLQVVGAWLRGSKGGPTDARADPGNPATWRGDHFDMTRRRRSFESWHKQVGYAVLLLAWLNLALGLDRLGLPLWWGMAPAALLTLLFLLLERLGWRRDTWEAIWGPKPAATRRRTRRSPPREAEP